MEITKGEAGFRYFFTSFLNCLSEEAYLSADKLSKDGNVREDARYFRVSISLAKRLKAYSVSYPLARFKDIMLEGYADFVSAYRQYSQEIDERIYPMLANAYPDIKKSLWSVWVEFLAEQMGIDIIYRDLEFLESH